jgi:hypothetical protein
VWLAKKCHQKQGRRRRVQFAERKWSLSASHQFCSAGSSRISRSHVRGAVLRKHSGSSAFEDPEIRGADSYFRVADDFRNSPKSRRSLAAQYLTRWAVRRHWIYISHAIKNSPSRERPKAKAPNAGGLSLMSFERLHFQLSKAVTRAPVFRNARRSNRRSSLLTPQPGHPAMMMAMSVAGTCVAVV